MKIIIGNYYIGDNKVIKVMKKSNNPLFKKAYDVRSAREDGIGWSTLSEDLILDEFIPCSNKDLYMIEKIFDLDPNSKI